jgi:hypothetical protein
VNHHGRRVHGCGGSIASLLPYRKATKIFLPISILKEYFILQIVISLRTYITYSENIASFNVLHRPFIRMSVIVRLDISIFPSNMQETII